MIPIISDKAAAIRSFLDLTSYPVGVKFLKNTENLPEGVISLKGYRYCQALMRARQGAHVMLDSEGIACPAAAAAFGFKSLPKGLKTGKGLVGFGIVKEKDVGKTMFEGMTSLPRGTIKSLYLFPMETASMEPDVVVVEDETEKLMWLALASLNATGGKRIQSNTAILQATCVDATLIPYVKQQFNMSMGCYGCRDATDIQTGETLLGFPFKDFYLIAENLAFLSQKAIPDSRSKNAFALLHHKDAERIEPRNPF